MRKGGDCCAAFAQCVMSDQLLAFSPLASIGVSGTSIARAVADGVVVRIGRGLYQLPDSEPDLHAGLIEIAKLAPKAVICLTSALPWITEAKTALGRNEGRDRTWLLDWLKRDGRSLGDPGKNPWCGDFVETCIRMAAVGGKQVRAELEGVGDAGVKGFGRMSKEASGARTFTIDYRHAGRQRRMTIGRWPEWARTTRISSSSAAINLTPSP